MTDLKPTFDPIKIGFRKEVELAINYIKSKNVHWNKDLDINNTGSITDKTCRVRRRSDEPMNISLSMLDKYPQLISKNVDFDKLFFDFEFTSFDVQKTSKIIQDQEIKTRPLHWEGLKIKNFPKNTKFYGGGETGGNLLLNDMFEYPFSQKFEEIQEKYLLRENNKQDLINNKRKFPRNRNNIIYWNTDSFKYNQDTESLYQSHNWIIAVEESGKAVGIFLDSTFRTVLHFHKSKNHQFWNYYQRNKYIEEIDPQGFPIIKEYDPSSVDNDDNSEIKSQHAAIEHDVAQTGENIDDDSEQDDTIPAEEEGDEEYEIYFINESKTPEGVYLIQGENVEEVLSELTTKLTGTIEIPPKWSLGYQQCRYSYYPDQLVKAISLLFRAKKIPCDVMWMDIEYMDDFRCFTFHPRDFPSPALLNDLLHVNGFKAVYMLDPGIKKEEGYAIYDSGMDVDGNHIFIHASKENPTPIVGNVWPGDTVFPDFTNKKASEWWSNLFIAFLENKIDGAWNDMNEIACFQPGLTIDIDGYHNADEAVGPPDTNARYHNVYGLLMTKASRAGFLKASPERRPFVLTRANYMGGHKYAACWTGDNTSNWDDLHFSIPMVLNLSLSGQPFVGCDIGGFADNATGDLFARWMGIGALLPFARAHSAMGTISHEPWSFGIECENTCRRAIERRYRLLPYYYSLFWEASKTGLPIARPLFFADYSDPDLRDADDSFLLGSNLLVRAITSEFGKACLSPLPKNNKWAVINILSHDIEGEKNDRDLPELRIKQGTIIPLGPVVQFTEEKPLDPLTLLVYLSDSFNAEGSIYEDEGDGYRFRDEDYYLQRKFIIHKEGDHIVFVPSVIGGQMPLPSRNLALSFVGQFDYTITVNDTNSPISIPISVLRKTE